MTFDYEESGDGYMVIISYTQQKQTTDDTKSVNGGVNGGVNNLLIYIQANPGLNATKISENLSISKRTIERWIRQLKEAQKIAFQDAPRNGGYYAQQG